MAVGTTTPSHSTTEVNGAPTTNGTRGETASMTNGVASSYEYPKHYLGKGKPLRIIMVGAGLTGIAAVKLYKDAFPDRDVELIIYEKNADFTGTWLENRYPG